MAVIKNNKIFFQADDNKHESHMTEAIEYLLWNTEDLNRENNEDFLTLVSREMDKIQINKNLLPLFSSSLVPLLATHSCISPTLFLPDCSTSSIKSLLNIITSGYTLTDEDGNIDETRPLQ